MEVSLCNPLKLFLLVRGGRPCPNDWPLPKCVLHLGYRSLVFYGKAASSPCPCLNPLSPTWRKAQLLLNGPRVRRSCWGTCMGRATRRLIPLGATGSVRQAHGFLLNHGTPNKPPTSSASTSLRRLRARGHPATRCVTAGLRWKASGLRWISLMWLGHVPLNRTPLGLAGAHGAGAFDPLLPTAGTPAQGSPTGPARWSCNCAAGCPTDPWCWWATTAMPCWICSTAASPSVNPLP